MADFWLLQDPRNNEHLIIIIYFFITNKEKSKSKIFLYMQNGTKIKFVLMLLWPKKLNVFFSVKEKKSLLVNRKGGKKMKMENASNLFL